MERNGNNQEKYMIMRGQTERKNFIRNINITKSEINIREQKQNMGVGIITIIYHLIIKTTEMNVHRKEKTK